MVIRRDKNVNKIPIAYVKEFLRSTYQNANTFVPIHPYMYVLCHQVVTTILFLFVQLNSL